MKFCAALAHKDISGKDGFTAEFLYSEPLGVGITPVFCRSAAFFMSHILKKSKVKNKKSKSDAERIDIQHGKILDVSVSDTVALAALFLEHNNLRIAVMFGEGCINVR